MWRSPLGVRHRGRCQPARLGPWRQNGDELSHWMTETWNGLTCWTNQIQIWYLIGRTQANCFVHRFKKQTTRLHWQMWGCNQKALWSWLVYWLQVLILPWIGGMWAYPNIRYTPNMINMYPGWNFRGGLGAQFCRYNLVGPNLVSYKKIGPNSKFEKTVLAKSSPLEPRSYKSHIKRWHQLFICLLTSPGLPRASIL